ncbi:MAG: hypothetical protein ACI4EJ_07905 [Bacteroides sp.]
MTLEELRTIFNDKADVTEYIIVGQQKGIQGCIDYIKQLTGCDEELAKQYINKYDFLKPMTLSQQEIAHVKQEENKLYNKPKCPTCNSTNIKKISTTAKVAGAVTFGLLSKNATSQFKCNNCGYKW